MPTLVNNLRAIRGPVTAVPVTAGSGIEIAADTQNNQIVISSNLEAGSGIEIVDDNGKAKIINSDNAQALPIVAGTGVKLSVVNNQVVVSADETVLWSGTASKNDTMQLSEPFSNFHYLEIYGSIMQDNGTKNMLPACRVCVDDVVLPASFNITGFSWWGDISRYKIQMNIGTYASTYSAIQHAGGTFQGYWDSQWQAAENNNLKINRIVGINRLSN